MQKQEKRRDLRLKRFWRSPKTTSSEESTGYESPTRHAKPSSDAQRFNHLHYTSLAQSASSAIDQTPQMSQKPTCSLPLLQVWPSQPLLRQEGFVHLRRNSGPEGHRDSPRGEADGQSFVFPIIAETSTSIAISRGAGGGRGSTSTGGSTGAGSTSTGDSGGGAGSSSGSGSGACSTTTSTTTTTTSTPGSSNNITATGKDDLTINLEDDAGILHSSSSSNHLTLLPVGAGAMGQRRRSSLFCDTLHAGDSGIDSVQASPSPNAIPPPPGATLISLGANDMRLMGGSCHVSPATTPTQGSPNLSLGGGCSASAGSSHIHKSGRMAARASISVGPTQNYRRKSSALLHPDHARLFALRMKHAAALERAQTSPDQTSIEDCAEFHDSGALSGVGANNLRLCSASSSTTSSLTSVAAVSLGGIVCTGGGATGSGSGSGNLITAASTSSAAVSGSAAAAAVAAAMAAGAGSQQRVSDPWLQPQSDRERDSRYERRRSSTMTARYSLFDALDLEYALLRAAARGSVGPYSLSESIHKLTFTQSLAFPALARGLATKRRRSATRTSSRPLNPNESGVNTCAKVVTAVILVGISFMVFLIVYKFVRT